MRNWNILRWLLRNINYYFIIIIVIIIVIIIIIIWSLVREQCSSFCVNRSKQRM